MSFQSAKQANGSSNREAKGFLLLITVLMMPFILQYCYRWFFYKPQPSALQVTYLSDTCEVKKPYTAYSTSYGYAITKASYPQKGNTKDKGTHLKQHSIDINMADSTALETLPGIGPAFASRIIKYRNLLGGYMYVEQLKEIYGMPPETYERIKPNCIINTAKVKKIAADSLWIKPYKFYHPYLSKELKQQIQQASRKQHYSMQVVEELVRLSNPKLLWYIHGE